MKLKNNGADTWVIPLRSHNLFLLSIKQLRWCNLYLGTLTGVITGRARSEGHPLPAEFISSSEASYFISRVPNSFSVSQGGRRFPSVSPMRLFLLGQQWEREWGWGKGLSRIVSWLPKCSFIFFLKFWDIESNYSPLRVQIKATAMYGQVSMCQEVCLITFLPCLFFKTHNSPMETLLLLFSLFPCWGNWELLKSNNNLELILQGICKIQRLKSSQF